MSAALPLEQFAWDKKAGRLIAEASDFGSGYSPGGRLDILSHHTGRTATFLIDTIIRDNDGDVVAWHYRPYNVAADCKVQDVAILND